MSPPNATMTPLHTPADTEELSQIVRREEPIDPYRDVSMKRFDRIVEYQPEEYTITVQGGVTLEAIQATLAENGQYLPFDPPRENGQYTIGEAVVSGLSGPSAYRYGILRDFIIGVAFMDGLGNETRSGGKVVKNAAGFDLPKFMVGSGGACGLITEATFKVFPKAPATRTLVFDFANFAEATRALNSLGGSAFALESLDLIEQGKLCIRIGGLAEALPERIHNLEAFLSLSAEATLEADDAFWNERRDFLDFTKDGVLCKLAVGPGDLKRVDAFLDGFEAQRRYSLGGAVAFAQTDRDLELFRAFLEEKGLSAQILNGPHRWRVVGSKGQSLFYRRVKKALDPNGIFPELYL